MVDLVKIFIDSSRRSYAVWGEYDWETISDMDEFISLFNSSKGSYKKISFGATEKKDILSYYVIDWLKEQIRDGIAIDFSIHIHESKNQERTKLINKLKLILDIQKIENDINGL